MNATHTIGRRAILAALAGSLAVPGIVRGQTAHRVVILGGGFGGATAARTLRHLAPDIAVTLIERDATYYTCPLSNGVLGGMWGMDRLAFGYDAIKVAGVEVIHGDATAIDPAKKTITLASGQVVTGDVLVLSPGIQFIWSAIEGLSPEVAQKMPHAWKAGPQTQLLRDQLVSMQDGGTVVISIPLPPFRCPPGPYERISLIANYLKTAKPKSKIMVLDAQDAFAKQDLFEEAWQKFYPGLIERIPGANSGAVISVDPATMRVSTGFDDVTAAVANIIPPQRAAQIVIDAGLDTGLGWCPVEPLGFESTVAPGVYILGDAAIAGDMPKSGFSANVQAKVAAFAIVAKLRGEVRKPSKLINVCYSLGAPDWGFSIADVFSQGPDKVTLLEADGRTTPVGATSEVHAKEAKFDLSWHKTITSQLWD